MFILGVNAAGKLGVFIYQLGKHFYPWWFYDAGKLLGFNRHKQDFIGT